MASNGNNASYNREVSIDETTLPPGNSEAIENLKQSVMKSISIYLRIPTGNELDDDRFNGAMKYLSDKLPRITKRGNGGCVDINQIRLLREWEVQNREYILLRRFEQQFGPLGKSHEAGAYLSDETDFGLIGRIERYLHMIGQ